jgi:transcriptional regulator with XRE-family HTH domain
MVAQPTTEQARARWSAFLRAQLDERNLTQADLARLVDRPTTVDKSVVNRWLGQKLLPTVESAIRVAQVLRLPASVVLREAGHEETASYIEAVAGPAADDMAALEPLIARVRTLTEGLTPEQRKNLEDDLLQRAGDLFVLAEAKAAKLRRDAGPDSTRGAS